MGFFKIIKRFIGGLNLDNAPDDMPSTDFTDGYDIVDRNPSKGASEKYIQPENNNDFAYDLGSISPICKKYQITINATNILASEENVIITMSIYLKYGYKINLQINYTAGNSLDQLADAISNEINTYFSYAIENWYIDTGNNTINFQFNLCEFFSYTDFFVSFSDDAATHGVYTTTPLNDAISTEKAGVLVPIEFANVSSAQQIWATTKSVEPATVTADGADISNVLVLTFGTENYLLEGEEIYMYGNGVGLYVCVQATSDPFKYNVYGSTEPVSGSCAFVSGTYSIVKNKRTASVIGYATKNYLNDTWDYTKLLCSINLNFRTYKQIQAYGMITNNGTIYNWTDHLNQIKRLYYFNFAESLPILTDGFLTLYNPNAIYDLDTIGQESNLQLGTNTAKVTLSIPSSAGTGGAYYFQGSKPEGNYVAFVRFKTIDGFYTTYSKASNVQWLHSQNVETHLPTLNSGLALNIFVEQIDYQLYDYLQVSIIHFTNDSWTGYSLPQQKINGLSELQIIDTGYNSAEYIDFNDANYYLNQIPFVFENAKSILPYALYEVAANVNIIKERDLTDWAKTITLTATRKEYFGFSFGVDGILPSEFKNFIFKGINDFDKCSNEWMSYMPYDHYRFCVFIDWEDGSPTSTYWIDDVSFNPIDTGISDGDASYRIDPSVALYYYQYYVEATNINLDYVLPNGEYLKDIVKDIRFGRTLCNPQVYATGLTIAFHKPDVDNTYPYAIDGMPVSTSDIVYSKFVLYSPDFANTGNNFSFNTINGDYIISYQQGYYGDDFPYTGLDSRTVIRLSPVDVSYANIYRTIPANNGQWTEIGQMTSNDHYGDTTYIRGGITTELQTSLIYNVNNPCRDIYYIRPYPTTGAYPISPENTQFFVIPQDKWFNKLTHNSITTYSLYGGDVFPVPSAYLISEMLTTVPDYKNTLILFFSFNRTNASLRSGRYPLYTLENYLTSPYLTDSAYGGDAYGYSQAMTPRYPFQTSTSFNSQITQTTKLGSSIFYSEQSVSYDLAGGNRVWLPLNRKDLEATYGDIIHMEILLGFSETGLLIVWQPQRTTAQYFDNTANLKSSAGDLLIGNGEIMARKGADFTEYGCEHKWTIRKGQNPSGKDTVYWACFRKGAIMRLAADGTADLVGDINFLLTNKTFLALQNQYNNQDLPAHNYGCHAVWNNQTKEYILTLTLVPKGIFYVQSRDYIAKGQWVYSSETWGFENFPVFYKSLVEANEYPLSDTTAWEKHEGYSDDSFEIWTLVWNELDNKFKTFRTFNPKIYGQFNNTYVSSHPNYPSQIFEHNKYENEALFYCTKNTFTRGLATTNSELYRIECAGIESILPVPFEPHDRTKWIVKIEGKNFEIIGGGTDYLQMASVDNDDILPQYSFPSGEFIYYICNCQDPYIEGVVNEAKPRYVHFILKNTQSDDTLKRTEYYAGYDSLGTITTRSFTNKQEEEFYSGESNVQIKMDTTNNPTDNEVGENAVQGKWAKIKQIWRWGKQNRVLTTSVAIEETEYKKQ